MVTKFQGIAQFAPSMVEYVRVNGGYIERPSDISHKYGGNGSLFAILREENSVFVELVDIFDSENVIKTKNIRSTPNAHKTNLTVDNPSLMNAVYKKTYMGNARCGSNLLHYVMVGHILDLVSNYKYNKDVLVDWLRSEILKNKDNPAFDTEGQVIDGAGDRDVLLRNEVRVGYTPWYKAHVSNILITRNIDEILSIQNNVFELYVNLICELDMLKSKTMNRLMESFKIVAIVMSNMVNSFNSETNVDLDYILKAYTHHDPSMTKMIVPIYGEEYRIMQSFVR